MAGTFNLGDIVRAEYWTLVPRGPKPADETKAQ
jgi:hypothetical protein